jgi:hypothetical protein
MSVYFVLHPQDAGATPASSVSLPSTGGSVVVDLVLENSEPVRDLRGSLAATTANVVSVDASGWNDADNIRMFYSAGEGTGGTASAGGGTGGTASAGGTFTGGTPVPQVPQMASYYDTSLVDWYVMVDHDRDGVGDEACHTLACLDDHRRLVTAVFAYPLDGVDAPASNQRGSWYVGGPLGGAFASPLPPDRRVIATLTLSIAGEPGTHAITLLNAIHTDPEAVPREIAPGQPFTVTVSP